ncbi:DUF1127 domain-containing protein [Tropicimonas sp. IMCC6043]|nr:DUF1127 domain-containing protein [Tropicimonas sp. IMCC6043]
MSAWFTATTESARRKVNQFRAYRRTLRELNEMSDREADDLGLNRSQFPEIARAAVDAA